jgi:hypothetical protein
MNSSPQRSRIFPRIIDENRIRPSNEPPHSSVRRFDHGVQNWSTRPWYAAKISMPSKPAARARAAAPTNPSTTSSISADVIAWLPSASWYDGRADGDQFGANELSASPCSPT